MLINLPKQFPLDKLEQFTIGNVEPENDLLLTHSLGICKIRPVLEFMRGEKSLIVGARGTGKSTLFKLAREGTIRFAGEKTFKNSILAIDESLDYVEIRNKVFKLFHTSIDEETIKCRFFWEVYLLFRILISLEGDSLELPEGLKKNLKNIKLILNYEDEEVSFLALLKNLKLTGGIKFTQSPMVASATPQFSLEPRDFAGSAMGERTIKFNIETCKKEINSFLELNKKRYFVMLDSLDEFTVKETYASQKMFIQGLLECERSYIKYNNIKLKLFLRSDLFDRLDYEALGAEKVAARKINLTWSSQDIRRLIAQRITYNYLKLLNLAHLELTIEERKLYLDESSALDAEKTVEDDNPGLLRKIIGKIIERDSRTGRHISFTDEVNREIITSIFPKRIKHRMHDGSHEDCEFTDFCSSHLSLSNNTLTPRMAIMYIEKCLECTINYYKDNPDVRAIELDNHNEYPLIKKSCIAKAYEEFRDELWDSFSKNMPLLWRPLFNIFRDKRQSEHKFRYKDLESMLMFDNSEQLRQFLAFLCHIGVLENMAPHNVLSQRTYKLPIVLRQ